MLLHKPYSFFTIVFSDSLSSSLGGRYACPNDIITYTCTATTTFDLRWLVSSYVSQRDDLIFFKNEVIGMTKTKDIFNATLIDVKNISSNPNLFEISTTLDFPVSQVENTTTITCRSEMFMDALHLYIASRLLKINVENN